MLDIPPFRRCFLFPRTATTQIYTLSLHDALPISEEDLDRLPARRPVEGGHRHGPAGAQRSEEHTSELQSQSNLVCRLLLEKKKNDATSVTVLSARTPPAPASGPRGI